MAKGDLAKRIDHTVLKADATVDDIEKACGEAKRHKFASVCVSPFYVPLAFRMLKGTGIKVCTVVGFPLGSTTPELKAVEAKKAIDMGTDEIDMVMNIGALKSGRYDLVRRDVAGVVRIAKVRGVITKVIIETCFLTDDEKRIACRIVEEAGADYVKTSTGFGPKGATVHDVKLIRSVVGDAVGIKASGGIRNARQAIALIRAGATRIGSSYGVEIVKSLT